MLRPATPLAIIFLLAFVLLLLSTISTPIIKAIPLGSYQGYDFGVFGFCNGDACEGPQIGYNTGEQGCMAYTPEILSLLVRVWPAHWLTTSHRWPFPRRERRRLLVACDNTHQSLLNSYRASHCSATGSGLLFSGRRCAFPRAWALSSLPLGFTHPHHPDSADHSFGLPGRHSAVRASRRVGWLDHACGYNPHRCI